MIIPNRRPLAEELGIHANTEVAPRFLVRVPLEDRNDVSFDRPRKNGASDADEMVGVPRAQEISDLCRRARDVVQAEAAVVITGSTHTNNRDVRVLDRVRRGAELVGRYAAAYELRKPGFDNMALTSIETFDFRRVDVDTEDLVASRSEAGCRNRAHIS